MIYFTPDPSRIYIGSALNISERRIRHKYHLGKGVHKNTHLQRLYNKYGKVAFVFEVVEFINNPADLIPREQFYIDTVCPQINVLKNAGSCLGYRHSSETIEHLRKINTGKKMTHEQNRRNSNSQIGNKNARGAVRSEAHKMNLSRLKMKRVIDTSTGEILESIGVAAQIADTKYSTLYAKLSGRNRNDTNYKIL